MSRRHDFSRPWAHHRKQIYIWTSVLGTLISVVPVVLVGIGVWPMEPTGFIAAAAICVPIIIPMAAAWWDATGENRTSLEKANEFMIIWFPITAASQIFWELTWLVGDAAGLMNLTEQDRWGWLWWFYGAADTRYLISDAGLFGMETFAVIGGIVMINQWWRLLTAGDDVPKRINALWWSMVSLVNMLTVFGIYYVAEARDGFANIEQGFWGFALKFVFMNIPWLVAPLVSIPFIIKQLAYLYRTQVLDEGATLAGADLGASQPARSA
ncbi:Emopamil-binding protein [Mycobacterium sp. CPCC 205372]|uniref:Emopamil-binding protein n=1 Tax=Mycobacterium hippophais TaxID=3016340 RepID=A0ABT4PLC8_9MYCO|nr:Emopamil-binding protein [Mycobacterium hippophais]MCZ8377359.1 Emopamil-binding protein [Mycobacterium hippophais]